VSQANASAQSLNGVESEASGGLFVVSATLSSRLDADVQAVASCLGKTTSTKPPSGPTLSF
jgi:hypothetical protein